MENKKPNLKRLTFAVVIFLLIIIVGLITMRKPYVKYEISSKETLIEITGTDYEVYPADLAEMLAPDHAYNYIFLDLRNPYEYYRGHYGEAINVPVAELISISWLEQFKAWKEDGKTIILYGNNQLEANGPWMLLHQIGFKNTKILAGGYDYLEYEMAAADTGDIPLYMAEIAKYDFIEYMNSNAPGVVYMPDAPSTSNQKATAAPPPQKKPEVIIPVKQEYEEEEEEGC